MEFLITPYVSAGIIALGDVRETVRAKLMVPYESFYKTGSSKVETDAFDEIGVHVYYDKDYRVEVVELFEPAVPMFKNTNLLGTPYSQLLELFSTIDGNLGENDSGLTSYEQGIGLYAPYKEDEPNLNCEGIIVFKKGYYF